MNDAPPLHPELAQLISRLNAWLPAEPTPIDWRTTLACRWRRGASSTFGARASLEAITTLNCPPWAALSGIDEQKAALERNTRQFLKGLPANHALLTGSRGCGKSSLIKALLPRFAKQKLRLVEVDRDDLIDLPAISAQLENQPWRFVLFCDDLSFEPGEATYKPLKAALDGSVAGLPDNVLIYATSNRRHLMPEFHADNLATAYVGEEVHPGESVEEKVSLSDRFGLSLTFWPFSQDEYLAIVLGWITALGGTETEALHNEAMQWAAQRGGRSGRVAMQFARDWVGRQQLKRK